nr:hypothetical protein [uncultured Mucilaginibacter sp.]
MKKTLITAIVCCFTYTGFSQGKLISYEEIQYMLHNNINRDDSLLLGKGYTLKAKNEKKRTREYTLATNRGTFINLILRADGRRLFMELSTNDIQQHDVLMSSIGQYPHKTETMGDMEIYVLKDLCSIYVTQTENVPYDPMKKNYLIQIAPEKNVMAYD